MSEQAFDTALRQTFKEFIPKSGSGTPFVDMLIAKYLQDSVAEFQLLRKAGIQADDLWEHILDEFDKASFETVLEAFGKSHDFEDKLYKNTYPRLKALAQEGKSYGDLFTEIYSEETYLNEIFVRLVEEQEEVAITSAKQLQELTGITELYSYFDSDKEKTVYYTGDREPTKEEAQAIAFKEIEQTFIMAMSYRYSNALENILQAGGKYSDLLKVKPSYFNLPDTWEGCLTTDQYSSILWAIEHTFALAEPNSSHRPDLKTVAKEIEAPYSVLMDVNKLCNRWKLRT